MNKIAILFMCLIMLLTAAVGTTLAFFTDTENSAVSTISTGSVDMKMTVELNESVNVPEGTAGTSAQDTTTLVLGQPIPTAPFVTNTGASDIYVRVRVLVHEDAAPYFTVKMPASSETQTASETGETDSLGFVYVQENSAQKYRRSALDSNGNCVEYLFVYTSPLKPNHTTEHSVSECFYFELPDTVPASAAGSEPDLNVSFHADAIQASTFNNALEAFEKFDGVPSATESETQTTEVVP